MGQDVEELQKLKFQSTPPIREATSWCLAYMTTLEFQSTPPIREATSTYGQYYTLYRHILGFLSKFLD